MDVTDWPPQYTIKRHWRAKHVKITYSHASGLEIRLPTRFSVKHIPSILEENKDWIITQRLKHEKPDANIRPTAIHFLAIQKNWSVHYFQSDKRPRIKQFNSDGIIVSGDITEFTVCRDKLRSWVIKQAKIILPEYFQQVAEQIGFPFREVSVRSQSTLWGSCSQDKSIRLNYKLLFLPEVLMRHIMIHELCHTIQMNHSDKFWGLVAKFDNDWQIHKKAMRRADQYMPTWL